jgi:hypothetical protein
MSGAGGGGTRRRPGPALASTVRIGLVALGALVAAGLALSCSAGPDGGVAPATVTTVAVTGTTGTSPGSTTTSSTDAPPPSVGGTTVPGATTTAPVTTSGPAPSTAPVPSSAPSTVPTTTGPRAPVTSVAPASSVPLPTPGVPDGTVTLDVQVFWVRPPQEERGIDLPGYRDPADGTRPLVVYGSATNNQARVVTDPTVRATWVDQHGTPIASFRTAVLRADSTTPASSLAPGESGDVIIVVTDPALATQLGAGGLVPELVAAGR